MNYTITVESGFSAKHQLKLPDGSWEQLHEHDWKVRAEVSSEQLNKVGVVMDFARLKGILRDAVKEFEGRKMEDSKAFEQNNTSAENVSKYIYERVAKRLAGRVKLNSVIVMEEPGCWAKFSK